MREGTRGIVLSRPALSQLGTSSEVQNWRSLGWEKSLLCGSDTPGMDVSVVAFYEMS